MSKDRVDLKNEFEMNMKQFLYGCNGTFTGAFFREVIKQTDENVNGGAKGNPCWMMSQAFTYGLIQGKRAERAKQKGEPFSIDDSYEADDEYRMVRMLMDLDERLISLTIEELEELRPGWIKGIERLEADPIGVEFANAVIDRMIQQKSKGVLVNDKTGCN